MNSGNASHPTQLQPPDNVSPGPATKRKRGGQKGNHNARTHGFFSSALTPSQWDEYWHAVTSENLDPQSAFIRVKLRAVFLESPPSHRALVQAASILAKLYGFDLSAGDRRTMSRILLEIFENGTSDSLENQ